MSDTSCLTAILDIARSLIPLLDKPRELAEKLGTVTSDSKYGIYVTPHCTEWKQIIVSLVPGRTDINSLEIIASPASLPRTPEFIQRLGTYRVPPCVHWDQPERLVFTYDPDPAASSTTEVVVVTEDSATKLEDAGVQSIMIMALPR
jgi:hypothetical protein